MNNTATTTAKPLSFNMARKEIVADKQKVVKTDYAEYVGPRRRSAKEILRHVKRGTYFGKEYVNNFSERMKVRESGTEPEIKETGFSFKKFIRSLFAGREIKCA